MICRTENLKKMYGNITVLSDVNLHIPKGAIYGLIGRNGAGKTTLIKALAGLVIPTAGSIYILDQNIRENDCVKKKIGYTIENPVLFLDMSVRENIHIIALQKGIKDKKSDELLEIMGLKDCMGKKAKYLSLGMKQKLSLIMALLGEPEFLVLDEPLNGLDPVGIVDMRYLLKELNQTKETTILISSHILDELDKIASHYGIMYKGKLIKEVTKKELSWISKRNIRLKVSNIEKAINIFQEKLKISKFCVKDNMILIFERIEESAIINKILVINGIEVFEMRIEENLENYFIEEIGGENVSTVKK